MSSYYFPQHLQKMALEHPERVAIKEVTFFFTFFGILLKTQMVVKMKILVKK